MSLNDRAAALAPYAEQLLNNRDVHDAIQRAANAGRDSYERARGTSPSKAVKDKRLQRRLQETAQASWEAWAAVAEPSKPKRRRRWGRRIALVTVAVGGAFVALNTEARETVLGLLPSSSGSSQ
jgi:ferric-dicitrate binding protein FerR (iron transport regulator)